MLFGSDYTGATCGGSEREGLKRLAYPRMNADVLAAAAKVGSSNSADLVDNIKDVKFYGICVSECPLTGNYVCNLDAIAALRKSYNTLSTTDGLVTDKFAVKYISNVQEQSVVSAYSNEDTRAIYTGCWYTYLDTRSIFYRCLPVYNKNETMTVTCTEPEGLEADDPACQVKSVVSAASSFSF